LANATDSGETPSRIHCNPIGADSILLALYRCNPKNAELAEDRLRCAQNSPPDACRNGVRNPVATRDFLRWKSWQGVGSPVESLRWARLIGCKQSSLRSHWSCSLLLSAPPYRPAYSMFVSYRLWGL